MAKFSRNFSAGKMNKVLDERFVPQGEYIDALNVRMGSTEMSEIGVIENTKGNTKLTQLQYNGKPLSSNATTIGSIADGEHETVYWFVHDSSFPVSAEAPLGKIDMIVSFNETSNLLTYHIISVNDGANINTTLNFNSQYLITGLNIIDNLIFFTDDYNQPRFFNIQKGYALPILGVDDALLWERILVIKRPPTESPDVELATINGAENYMEDRFLCFAYRYQYEDGEYSATSQYSAAAFFPMSFDITNDSFLNEGMVNQFNAAIVTYNTGGPLVKSIDLLFKDMNSNVIKVIEKLNKKDLGFSDYAENSYTFSNSKIFTILPESELLRLYDNVPLLAKAQTIMGNRLMYGNYVEGYDLIDKNGNSTKMEYFLDGISEDINLVSYDSSANPTASNYTIDGLQSIADSSLTIDFSGINLVEGAVLNISFTFAHASFSSGTLPIQTQNILISFYYELPSMYASIYAMVSSVEFQNRIGTSLNILPVYDPLNPSITPCDGTTVTDNFNCLIPNNLSTYIKYESGINVPKQPINVTAVGDIMNIQLLAMRFVNDIATPTLNVYEYYKILNFEITYQEIGSTKSLHSNRDYEVGIVYMDEFNRATTALVSPRNTFHFSCATSPFKNSIQVNIPPTQIAPYWAKRYKFVIKPDKAGYETIYSDIYYQPSNTNDVYILLEGENARKVEVGDRYIVKADALGPKQSCSYATVLEKEAKTANFLNSAMTAGVYMKVQNNDFVVSNASNSIFTYADSADGIGGGNYGSITLNFGVLNPATSLYEDIEITEGTKISITLGANRPGTGNGNNSCERRSWSVSKTFTSPANYANAYLWFIGEGIFQILVSAANSNASAGGNQAPPVVSYISALQLYSPFYPSGVPASDQLVMGRNTTTNKLNLTVGGGTTCGGIFASGRTAAISGSIKIVKATQTLIFETLPVDALPDVFYENELSLPINSDGEHMGNIQDQSIAGSLPAIIDTGFFNCYSFANGAESYKIRDSIIGRTLELGNRVTSVAAQDYQQADRFSDITYSGIYNNESNVNKLNEFNLGLINYKHCESSFGPILIMDGRQTDVLTLQEDKISYVLAGKNLLSDAAAGGAVTSVPEVLGTQISRVEKYGISFNAESYVHWGYDRYFTDAKRGAVIQMKGDSYSNDQLKVISESGMRTWFRDLFKTSFQTQKLGAYDPYMDEYVLSSNDILIPQTVDCLTCGFIQVFTFEIGGGSSSFCVNEGLAIGEITITYNIVGSIISDFQLNAEYDSVIHTSGWTSSSGSFTFTKNVNDIQTTTIEVISNDILTLEVLVSCVDPIPLTVVEVVISNDSDSGDTIHTQYRYFVGSYSSPLQSSFVQLAAAPPLTPFVISRYNAVPGFVGTGAFPPDTSQTYLITNKFSSDTFTFDPLYNKFQYLMSSTLYGNNITDMTTLLSIAPVASINSISSTVADAVFTVPSLDSYLYLIWDLRASSETRLCYGISASDVCCNCDICTEGGCLSYTVNNVIAPSADIQYVECGTSTPTTVTVFPNSSLIICLNKDYPYPTIVSGVADITIYNECGC